MEEGKLSCSQSLTVQIISSSSCSVNPPLSFSTTHQPLPSWTFMLRLFSSLRILSFLLCANPPCPYPPHLSILLTPYLSQYFDEEQDDHEYPFIMRKQQAVPPPLHPLSPTWGPRSAGKKGARGTGNARAGGREGE